MTSAPEDTAPRITTSPSGQIMCWPERTLSSTTRVGASVGVFSPSGMLTGPEARPPIGLSGHAQSATAGQDLSPPSMPSTRMPRSCRAGRRWGRSGVSACMRLRSRITGLPAKKPTARWIWWSSAASQSTSGVSGVRVRARKERPDIRMREELECVPDNEQMLSQKQERQLACRITGLYCNREVCVAG